MLLFLGTFIALCVVATVYAIVRTIQLRRELVDTLADGNRGLDDSSGDARESESGASSALSLSAIAALEKSLPQLDMVVIFAHTIERPRDLLRDAVEANLARGVRYRFLISPSSLKSEAAIFLSDFVTSAKYIKEKMKLTTPVEEMVSLEALTDEWNDAPFIFYRQRLSDSDARSTLVFRGATQNSGLADTYYPVPPAYAHTVKRFLMSQESKRIDSMLKDFRADNFVDEVPGRVLEFSSGAR